jgi:hypothetical protein
MSKACGSLASKKTFFQCVLNFLRGYEVLIVNCPWTNHRLLIKPTKEIDQSYELKCLSIEAKEGGLTPKVLGCFSWKLPQTSPYSKQDRMCKIEVSFSTFNHKIL